MVIKVYVSGISGNKEVKKRQQRVTMILDSKNIKYDLIDIAEPGKENEKEFMQDNAKGKDSKYVLPPQMFNDEHYLGDYEDFDMANELDKLDQFLKLNNDTFIESKPLNGTVFDTKVTNGSTTELESNDKINGDKLESSIAASESE